MQGVQSTPPLLLSSGALDDVPYPVLGTGFRRLVDLRDAVWKGRINKIKAENRGPERPGMV